MSCMAFARCQNDATTTIYCPIFGDIPACQRCKDKLQRIDDDTRRRRTVKVSFEDGNTLQTEIIGTKKQVEDYYRNNKFQFGDTEEHPKDNLQTATNVEFVN